MKLSKIILVLLGIIFSGLLYAAPFAICCTSHHVHDGLRSFWVGTEGPLHTHNTPICKERSYDDTAYAAGNCRATKEVEAPFGVCCTYGKNSFWLGLQTPPTEDPHTLCKQFSRYATNSRTCYTSH